MHNLEACFCSLQVMPQEPAKAHGPNHLAAHKDVTSAAMRRKRKDAQMNLQHGGILADSADCPAAHAALSMGSGLQSCLSFRSSLEDDACKDQLMMFQLKWLHGCIDARVLCFERLKAW